MNKVSVPVTDWQAYPTSAQRMGLDNGEAAVADYASPEVFEREREAIYRRAWLLVGREEEVPSPGSFIARTVPTLDASIVITRGKDGIVRAFHNACSHRGVALVQEARGETLTFRCPYHAWTYGIDGALRAIPSEQDFPQIDKAKNGLAPVAIDIWNGFLFVNLAEAPETTLAEFLAGMDTALGGMPFHDYPFLIRYEEDVAANWKLLVNAFNEGYHIPFLHPKTLGPQLLTDDNPFMQYHDIRCFGPHTSSTLQRNYAWRPNSPVLQFAVAHMLPTSVPNLDGEAAPASLTAHPGINVVGIENFGTEVVTIFPNVILQPLANGYLLFTFWPTAVDRMTVDVRVYSKAAPADMREEFAAANMLAATRDVLTEDIAMSQVQQRGLLAVPGGKVYFGENEAQLRFFAQAVAGFMAGASPQA
jgi:phenylpropionate dioxygenase-like ring-hydroxylating dioxygenase large terminal subunit